VTAGPCTSAWQALRWDPLPWLLDGRRPGFEWRLLVELMDRPLASPAVVRAMGAASAEEPVASLLRELHPDGTWATSVPPWRLSDGPVWRLVTAVSLGADPTDPRLQSAARRLLEESSGVGGFASRPGSSPSPWATARLLEALAGLGFWRHSRFQEALAWLEEGDTSWGDDRRLRSVTAVATLTAMAGAPARRRPSLVARATDEVMDRIGANLRARLRLGHPNLGRTDIAEMLWTLARAGVPFDRRMAPALGRLQSAQDRKGRWRRTVAVPPSLPVPGSWRKRSGRPSRWVSLRATVGILRYAVDAGLPRLFPAKPES
jgi:hypothetical protein